MPGAIEAIRTARDTALEAAFPGRWCEQSYGEYQCSTLGRTIHIGAGNKPGSWIVRLNGKTYGATVDTFPHAVSVAVGIDYAMGGMTR